MKIRNKKTGKTYNVIKGTKFSKQAFEIVDAKNKKADKNKDDTTNAQSTDRFDELKAKGWVNLNREEKKEYRILKESEVDTIAGIEA
jgi:hypothetical protein